MSEVSSTPNELWLLIKSIAETNLNEISNRVSRGESLLEWHQEEVSSLASLLKEQA